MKQQFAKGSEDVVQLCCVVKPLISWNAERVASVGRERCGGQGYMSINLFGSIIGFAHSGITAEGDNCVLMQKVFIALLTSRWQRTCWKSLRLCQSMTSRLRRIW